MKTNCRDESTSKRILPNFSAKPPQSAYGDLDGAENNSKRIPPTFLTKPPEPAYRLSNGAEREKHFLQKSSAELFYPYEAHRDSDDAHLSYTFLLTPVMVRT